MALPCELLRVHGVESEYVFNTMRDAVLWCRHLGHSDRCREGMNLEPRW